VDDDQVEPATRDLEDLDVVLGRDRSDLRTDVVAALDRAGRLDEREREVIAAALPCLVQLLGGEDRRGEGTDHDGVVDRREVRGPYPQVQAEIALSTVRVDQAHRLASDFGGRLRNCQREGGLALPALPGKAGDHFGGGGAAPAASGGTGLGDVIQCG